jgi:hypothetical protein
MAKAKRFDREAWLAHKEERLAGAKAALQEGLKALKTSADWQRLLETMAQAGELSVSRLSFGNQMLVQMHLPGTRRAATFKRWLDHKRSVRKGEHGVGILAPVFRSKDVLANEADDDRRSRLASTENAPRPIAFKLITVFAEDQTEGEPIPEPKIPDVTEDEAFEGSLERLREVALVAPGKPVTDIAIRPRRPDDLSKALGWYERSTKRIVVITDGRTRAQMFRTMVHEMSHALLHVDDDGHSRPEREIEAESTAFVVCQALGLDSGSYSFPYLATWAQGEDAVKLIAASGQRITTTATRIVDALCGDNASPEEAAA